MVNFREAMWLFRNSRPNRGELIVGLSGGLGNQLFQFAAGMELATRHGLRLSIDSRTLRKQSRRGEVAPRKLALTQFTLPVRKARLAHLVKLKMIRKFSSLLDRFGLDVGQLLGYSHIREKGFAFSPITEELRKFNYISGNWTSPQYFQETGTYLRTILTPITPLSVEAKTLIEQIDGSNAICVHVRRGDYVGTVDLLEEAYYRRGISYLRTLVGHQKAYIFSDDIAWCQRKIESAQNDVIVLPKHFAGNDEAHDMALMGSFRNFVVANSTFAWWAVWLAGERVRHVVSPSPWSLLRDSDFVPEKWIKIDR